ncbi:NAD(P)-binding protein [Aspergillus ellipticus CBS 707.79]|uniref:NAD(P)-binding protein n=1 Tax=Aspergillus ellipticus CBS 707.79 TaxID=1448320 RepID=A0A319D5E8_9EURO|nr:NAD(P)-binding protein [Aspergillus ellipticus CBS 707.79]
MNPINTIPYELPADAPWLVTGCSSGMGREIAQLIASKPNQRLITTARNPSSLSYLPEGNPSILKLPVDVISPTSVTKAFEAAPAHFGANFHIDVLVNTAGYSLEGDTEAITEEEMHDELETLFFGTFRATLNAVRIMRQHKDHRGGSIFNLSSVAGGWRESVAREMHPDWNIHFCLVKPGAVKMNFGTTSKKHIKPHEAYDGFDMPSRVLDAYVEKGLQSSVEVKPAAVADTLYLVASRNEKIPLRLPLSVAAVHLTIAKLQGQLKDLESVS